MRYKQIENFRITGPGLPEQGAVAVGPAELEAAYQAGRDEWSRPAKAILERRSCPHT